MKTRRSSAVRVSGATPRQSGASEGGKEVKIKNVRLDGDTVAAAEALQDRLGIKHFNGLVSHLITKATLHGIPGEPPMVKPESSKG